RTAKCAGSAAGCAEGGSSAVGEQAPDRHRHQHRQRRAIGHGGAGLAMSVPRGAPAEKLEVRGLGPVVPATFLSRANSSSDPRSSRRAQFALPSRELSAMLRDTYPLSVALT